MAVLLSSIYLAGLIIGTTVAFICTIQGVVFMGVSIGFPLLWKKKGDSLLFTAMRKKLNMKISAAWKWCCVSTFLYLAMLNDCSIPSSTRLYFVERSFCDALGRNYEWDSFVITTLLFLLGYNLYRKMKRDF